MQNLGPDFWSSTNAYAFLFICTFSVLNKVPTALSLKNKLEKNQLIWMIRTPGIEFCRFLLMFEIEI